MHIYIWGTGRLVGKTAYSPDEMPGRGYDAICVATL